MLLHFEAALLAGMTVLLAGPVSKSLARARWVVRAPHAALVLWQAIGLGGGLGVVTAGMTLAAADLEQRWLAGIVAVPRRWRQMGLWGWLGIAISIAVGVYLVSVTIISALRVMAARRAHRTNLNHISSALGPDRAPIRRGDAPVRLVDHPLAIAYGLPGLRHRVVLTRGALDALDADELSAVLAHEQAHARGRHDLIIQPFLAWAHIFPFLPSAQSALSAVGALVEMLADDAAVRRTGAEPLRSALRKLVGQHLDIGGRATVAWRRQMESRLARLGPAAPAPLPLPTICGIYLLAGSLVTGPPAVLLLS